MENRERYGITSLVVFMAFLGGIGTLMALFHLGVPAILGDKPKFQIISYLSLDILVFFSIITIIVHGIVCGFRHNHKRLILVILIVELFTMHDMAVRDWLVWKLEFNRKQDLLAETFKTDGKEYVKAIKRLEAGAKGNSLFRVYDDVNADWIGVFYAYTADLQMAFSYITGSMALKALMEYRRCIPKDNYASPLWDFFNVKYFYLNNPPGNEMEQGLTPVQGIPGLYINQGVFPRAFVLTDYRVFEDGDPGLLHNLGLPSNFGEMRKTVYLSEAPGRVKIKEPAAADLSGITIDKYDTHRISLTANMKTDGYLVLGEPWSPQWEAYVDGKKERVNRAYHLLRSIEVEKGIHRIEFVYNKNYIYNLVGKAVTICTILGIMVLLIIRRYSRSREST